MTGQAFYKKRGYTSQDSAYKGSKDMQYDGEIDMGNGVYMIEIFLTKKK